MSSVAMAADSTQSDLFRRDKYKSSGSNRTKEHQKAVTRSDKSVNKRYKKNHGSSSSSGSESSSDDSSRRQKYSKRKHRPVANDSCSDNDSDLDLSKNLVPIGGYISACDVMIEHMFRSISMKKLKAMLPEILKSIDLAELKQLCVKQLEGMSKKRISRILDGEDPENVSSSDSEDDDSGSSASTQEVTTTGVHQKLCEPRAGDAKSHSHQRSIDKDLAYRTQGDYKKSVSDTRRRTNSTSRSYNPQNITVLEKAEESTARRGSLERDRSSLNVASPSGIIQPAVVETTVERFKTVRPVTKGESQPFDCTQARAENENNINNEAENGRSSSRASDTTNIDSTFACRPPRDSPREPSSCHVPQKVIPVQRLPDSIRASNRNFKSPTGELSVPALQEDDVILNIPADGFSDDDQVHSSTSLHSLNCSTDKLSKAHSNRSEGTKSGRYSSSNSSKYDDQRLGDGLTNDNRHKSVDDPKTVVVANVQRQSYPANTPEKLTTASERKRMLNSSSADEEEGSSSSEIKRKTLVCGSEEISRRDVPVDSSAGRKITVTRPCPKQDDNSLCSGEEKLSVQHNELPQKTVKQTSNNQNSKSSASISPEVLSKTRLEILELEMRARAIKAMLRAQEELEKTEMSSKQEQQSERWRQRGPRDLTRRRSNESQRNGGAVGDTVSRQAIPLSARRSALPPSPPASRHRVVHRKLAAEIAARRRQRQFLMHDRLARFGSQQPIIRRPDSRIKLSAVSEGRRVLTKQPQRTNIASSRFVRLPTERAGHLSSGPLPLSFDVYRRRRFSRSSRNIKLAPTNAAATGASDVRRVFMSTQRRFVRISSQPTTARSTSGTLVNSTTAKIQSKNR